MRPGTLVDSMQAAALLGEQRFGLERWRHVSHHAEALACRFMDLSKGVGCARRREDTAPLFAADTERAERGATCGAPMRFERLNVPFELWRLDTTGNTRPGRAHRRRLGAKHALRWGRGAPAQTA